MEKKNSKKGAKTRPSFKKKKGKCYNCGKKRHFVRECRLSKANYAKINNPKEERERKT
jgi:hypothetical protein